METKLPFDVKAKDVSRTPPGMKDDSRRKISNPTIKDGARFEKYGRETNGEYTEMTLSIGPGGENAAHWHGSYSESFTCLKGKVGVYTASTGKIVLAPGESATVPPKEIHYWFNPGEEEAEVTVKLVPACEGMERSLYVLYGLAQDGKSGEGGVPKSLMHSAVIFSMADMWPAGLTGGLMTPLMKVLAFVGRAMGIEEQLLKKYWD